MSSIDFIKKSVLLWIGNIIVTIVGIISFYILTNILSTDEYGKFSLVMAIIAFLSLAFYNVIGEAIIIFSVESKKEALIYGLKIKLYFAITIFLSLFIFADIIAGLYHKPISLLIRIISFSFLFTPFIEAIKASSIGEKSVNKFTLYSVLQSIFMILLILILLMTKINVELIALTFVISNLLTALLTLKKIKISKIFKKKKNKFTKRMSKYIKDGFIYGITKNIFFQSPLIIAGYFISNKEIAFYSFAFSIGVQGILTFINSIQTMLLPYIATTKDRNKMAVYTSGVVKFGLILTLAITIIILILLPILLPLVFPKYTEAYKYFIWIFLAFVLLNLRAPMVILKAIGKMAALTKLSIISAITSIITGIILCYFFGLIGAIITLNINILVCGLIHIIYLKKYEGITLNVIPTKYDLILIKDYTKIFYTKFKSYITKN